MDWLKEYPLLKPLFLVLKHGLSSLSVDGYPNFFVMDTKRNGVASYSLVCMIVRYLQVRWKRIDVG
jgi:DNA polymerase sigma